MAIDKITENDFLTYGLDGAEDIPENPRETLQSFEKNVLMPKINEMIDELTILNPDSGGIAGAAENGFGTYTHVKTGTQHALTNAEFDYPNIKFVATADFEDGDTFVVNRLTKTAKTQDGEPLSGGYFKKGSVVTAFINGDVLNFKSGGAGLNFKVVGGTTQPESPAENTVWINTDTAISGWAFSADEPSDAAEGFVWIQTGASSPAAFSVAKDKTVMVYPVKAKQYISGAWVGKTAQSYIGGEWMNWVVVIYDRGTVGSMGIQKGTATSDSNTTYNENDEYIQMSSSGSTQYIYARTTSPISLDGVSSITLEGGLWCGSGTGDTGAGAAVCVSATADFSSRVAEAVYSNVLTAEEYFTLSLPVSLSGEYYVGVRCDRNGTAGTRVAFLNIYKLKVG